MGRLRQLVASVACVAAVATAADLPLCNLIGTDELPKDDLAACGLDEDTLLRQGTALYRETKCTTPACMRFYATLDAANPSECVTSGLYRLALRSGVLAPLYATCAALGVPTPATTTRPPAQPTPAPAPPVMTSATPATASPTTPLPVSSARSPTTTTDTPTAPSAPSPPPQDESSTSSSAASSTDEAPSAAPTPSTMAPAQVAGASNAPATSSAPTPLHSSESDAPSTPLGTTRAPQDAAVSSSSGGSKQTPIWIGVGVAAVLLVVAVVRWKSSKLPPSKEVATMGPTDPTLESDLTTAYTASADDDGVATAQGLASTKWCQQLDAQLRNDATLASWRISSRSITPKQLLGRGSHAFVHLVVLTDGTRLASKQLAADQATAKRVEQLIAEAHIATTLQHASIVKFEGVAWTSPLDFQLLFECMDGGDLRRYLDRTKPTGSDSPPISMWSPHKLTLALQLAEGLAYAHSFNPPLVHRDLKSRNILLAGPDAQTAKISDFGVARFASENDTMTTGVGTNRWLAPEVISGGGTYSESCDIYSFGVVLTELDTHDVPLARELAREASPRDGTATRRHQRSELWLLREVAQGRLRPSVSASCPEAIRDLAMRCLALDPNDRPNALEVAYTLRKLARGG